MFIVKKLTVDFGSEGMFPLESTWRKDMVFSPANPLYEPSDDGQQIHTSWKYHILSVLYESLTLRETGP